MRRLTKYFTLPLTILTAALLTGSAAAGSSPKFTADFTSSYGECSIPPSLQGSVQADLGRAKSNAQAHATEKKLRPANAVFAVDGKEFHLKLGTRQVSPTVLVWVFKPVALHSTALGKALIGKAGVLSYSTKGGSKVFHTRVHVYGCG